MRKCLFIFIFFLVKTIGMAQSVDSTNYADSTDYTDYIDSLDENHSLNKDHSVIDTSKYAILYVYRPSNLIGALIAYDLHVDDKVVCRVKNGKKHIIKIYKEGSIAVWAETEVRKSVKLNVKFGEGYY